MEADQGSTCLTEQRGRDGQKDVHNLIAIAYSDRRHGASPSESREHLDPHLVYHGCPHSSPCPRPNPAVLAPKPPDCNSGRHIPYGLQRMRPLVVGCLSFLHLAQLRSRGDWQRRTVDVYLLQREFTRRTTELPRDTNHCWGPPVNRCIREMKGECQRSTYA